jgi:hypothetical protein
MCSGYPVKITSPRDYLFRPFIALVFLVALQVVFTFWTEVGGQYHLDLMFWPWKFGLGLGAAVLITAMAATPRRARLYGALLIMTVIVAGIVTYYYHVNEPPDDSQDSDDQPTQLTALTPV